MAVSFLSYGPKAASTANPSVPWPNGAYGTGDFGVMLAETSNETLAVPSNWSEFVNSPQGNGIAGTDATATRLTMFWKRATSAAEANVALADAGDHGIAQILVFRGVHSLDTMAINVTAGDATNTVATSVATCPAVSTTTDGCFVLACCSEGIDNGVERFTNWSNANLSGFTVLTNVADATANGGGFSAAGGIKLVAGNTSVTTMAVAASIQGRITVALTPAPSTGESPGWVRPFVVDGVTVAPPVTGLAWVRPGRTSAG